MLLGPRGRSIQQARIAPPPPRGHGVQGLQNETHLSSLQSSPRPYAWVPRPHEDAWRAGSDQCQTRQGPQAPGCLSRGACRAVAPPPVLGRISRSVDFERVLGIPACARSTHFAIHFLAGRPSRPSGRGVATPRASQPLFHELSTEDPRGSAHPVDESSLVTDETVLRTTPLVWLGAIVPKRHARRSVTRSLLKRQIRAAVLRRQDAGQKPLRPGLWVVRLRAPFDSANFPSAASGPLRVAARGELDDVLGHAERRLAIGPPASRGAD